MKRELSCFYVKLEPYLRQWIIHESGGSEPVDFPRGSIERDLIVTGVTLKPKDESPDVLKDGLTAFYIHNQRGHNPTSYIHMPRRIKEELKRLIKKRFDMKLMQDLLAPSNHGRQLSEIVEDWMEKNGIECDEKNYNTVIKRFQRRREHYGLKFLKKQKKSKKNG